MRCWVIDDSDVLAGQLCSLLHELGWQTARHSPLADPAGIGAGESPVFVSLQLRGTNAFRLLRMLHAQGCHGLVAISGSGLASERIWAERAGAARVLCRPLRSPALASCLAQLQSRCDVHV